MVDFKPQIRIHFTNSYKKNLVPRKSNKEKARDTFLPLFSPQLSLPKGAMFFGRIILAPLQMLFVAAPWFSKGIYRKIAGGVQVCIQEVDDGRALVGIPIT